MSLDALMAEVRACRLCAEHLPHPPRPVLRGLATARVLIAGQAPGARVHASGIPFDDPSGERLRAWMAVSRETFYDESRIAILPMGFCFPGLTDKGADRPPRRECAPAWRTRLLAHLPAIEFTLLLGRHAQAWHLKDRAGPTLTATVASFRDHLPAFMPLPHPSWRNNAWLKRHQEFERELLPALRARLAGLLA